MANGDGWRNGRIPELIIGFLLVLVTVLATLVVEGARGESKFVMRCEYESLCKRLDRQDMKMTRIEDKVDRILEREAG